MTRLARGTLRQALLQKVRSVCANQGPEAVSIAKIGKELGVSSGAPFRIFASREHIFAALIEAEMARLDAAFEQICLDSAASPSARLSGLCQAYVTHARQEPAMFRLAFSISAKAMGAERLQELGIDVYDKVRRAVCACLPDDTAPDQIEGRVYLLWATIHGHVMLLISGQIKDQNIEIDDQDVINAAVQTAVRMG